MDYEALANDFMKVMISFAKNGFEKRMNGFAHGGNYMLYYLYKEGEAVLPNQISNEMGITSARTAAALKNLENKGLICREIDKNDRRQILVTLTDEGKKTAETQLGEFVKTSTHILESLGEDDAKEFIRIIKKLHNIPSKKA